MEIEQTFETISFHTIQKTIDYIEDNILEELAPSKIAQNFYISTSTISNLFKLASNITIMEYIRNRRLSLAGEELITSKVSVIDLALKYGYETPEAFTKAFTRFHGMPPSVVRRIYPKLNFFYPLSITVNIQGGWRGLSNNNIETTTKTNSPEQELEFLSCYTKATKNKGGIAMKEVTCNYFIRLQEMEYKEDWRILLSLCNKLNQGHIKFKIDGKTMIFAHGLEFKLEKIGLTFKWTDEESIKDFFQYKGETKSTFDGFKYFDTMFEGMKVRCMFYKNHHGDDTDEFLYQSSELVDVDGFKIPVQSLAFYYNNADSNSEYYKIVEKHLNQNR